MKSLVLLVLFVGIAAAAPSDSSRIVGGSLTTINQYPYGAALLRSFDFSNYEQACGGTIINEWTILTAAHCLLYTNQRNWAVRVGSSYASSGGTRVFVSQTLVHPNYNGNNLDYDFSLFKLSSKLAYSNTVARASIAGSNYVVPDGASVWAIGWGLTTHKGQPSEQLRQVEIWTVNQQVCDARYGGGRITNRMLCAGWLDVGGRDQCQQDSGGPLIHQGTIVGVCSWGGDCADAYRPGVNAKVSSGSAWIQANA